jgi:hypothetical protein
MAGIASAASTIRVQFGMINSATLPLTARLLPGSRLPLMCTVGGRPMLRQLWLRLFG